MTQNLYIGPFAFSVKGDMFPQGDSFTELFSYPIDNHYIPVEVIFQYSSFLNFVGQKIYGGDSFDVYIDGNTEHRYYHQVIDGKKNFYAHNSLKEHTICIDLYTGATTFGRALDIWRFLFLEKLLLEMDGIILHSSSVLWNDQILLFTAPSGTGKSTQANLWKKYEAAKVVNGDRNILIRYLGKRYCCGIPWHGSSSDCRNIWAPIRCISVIRQYPMDEIRPLSPARKVMYLYSELSKNSWDITFTDKCFQLLTEMITSLNIVQQNCTMNRTAVECLIKALEE